MKPDRWQKIEKIFQSALELDPAQRTAFLDEACSADASLRKEVESLMAADEQAGSFIEPSAHEGAADSPREDKSEAMLGRVVSHYRILSLLGSGGMGEVYLAQDTRLGRKVALKLLPAHFTKDEERVRRFQKEARAASALNHPNIVTVYDIGQSDSIHFIATEFIEGQTLREAIHGGKEELNELLEYLTQVADGLAKAHTSGIIHRDLKPDNIMISRDGYAKVLDFGLAKLIEPQTLATGDTTEAATALIEHTQPGVVMGTAGYMSPEQAQGKVVDHRSDVFSFGCILYEAVTRHKPFEGDSLIDVLHKIVYTQPPAITDFRPRCPVELQRVIRKCLVKDPERRYQSIKDVAIDLREAAEESEIETSRADRYQPVEGSQVCRDPAEALVLDTDALESSLSDSDPRVLETTRFSKASIALAIFGFMGAVVIWPAYRIGSVDSEFRLDCPKVVALSKAHEIVASVGYDASRLEGVSLFDKTDLDLKVVAAREGLSEARRAVREGKTGTWKIFLIRPGTPLGVGPPLLGTGKLNQGEFSVWIGPRGQLISFATPPTDTAVTELERQQAIRIAEETVRRMFSLDLTGFEMEFVKKNVPMGVAEITWRNQNLVFGHREVVRAELQGSKVTGLSQSLEPPQDSSNARESKSGVFGAAETARFVIGILAFIATSLLGVVFLIKGKRWNALRQRLPIASSMVIVLMLVAIFLVASDVMGHWLELVSIGIVIALIAGVASHIVFAGLFEWLRTMNPVRLYGADQLVKGRFLSKPVSAALVHGALGGMLVAGVSNSLTASMAMIPAYSPRTGTIKALINFGSILPSDLAVLTGSLLSVLIMMVIVELVERMAFGERLKTLIPALLIAISTSEFTQSNSLLVAITFLSEFLAALVMVHFYRSRGFAAALLVPFVSGLLDQATVSRYVGDPGFVLQSNLTLIFFFLLLAMGVWGYVRERAMNSLSAFGLD